MGIHKKEIEARRASAGTRPDEIRREKNLRSHERDMARRQLRREQADTRQARWAALSPKEQLADLDKRQCCAARQRARILAKLP